MLVGGEPPRIMRLSAAGANALADLLAGASHSPEALGLARRLVDGGLAHARAPTLDVAPTITVVVPARDRPAALNGCLNSLGGRSTLIVVDDGSRDPHAIASVCREHRATLLRHATAKGPGAARNTGARSANTDLVAFLDSDCIAQPGWATRLATHFADPVVGAVAPRIRPQCSSASRRWLARFDAARCPLDMGSRESAVVPGGRVGYVPSAALIVRREALTPFDERLRYGEDVDLVWRTYDAGWSIRYDPSVHVAHLEPQRWAAMLARRFWYGTSAAPVAQRHPQRLGSLVAYPMPSVAAALLISRRPMIASGIVAGQALAYQRRLRETGIPSSRTIAWSAQSVWHMLLAAGRAATMFALPLLLVGISRRQTRAAAIGLAVAGPLEEWVRRRPALDLGRWSAACVADDIAYGAGVWWGCLRHRTPRPLLPLAARAARTVGSRQPQRSNGSMTSRSPLRRSRPSIGIPTSRRSAASPFPALAIAFGIRLD